MKININLIMIILQTLFLLLLIPLFATSARPKQAVLNSNITAGLDQTGQTTAILTLNGFEKGEDGGDVSECDSSYHSDDDNIVALSTPWYAQGQRCSQYITITRADGVQGTTTAKVVDECDVSGGCRENIVDGSRAVWRSLGVEESDHGYGEIPVTWGML